MIKGIVFDLDFTLYNENLYFMETIRRFVKLHSLELQDFNNVYTDKLRLSSQDIFGDILKKLNVFTQEWQEELFALYQKIDLDLDFYPDATVLVSHAKQLGLKLGILTNGVIEAQRNKLKCLHLNQDFAAIICARQFGKEFEKPHVKPFKAIAEKLGLAANQLVFIGDNPKTDFAGAKAIGAKTVRIKRGVYKSLPSGDNVDLEINDLEEVKQIL